MEYDKAPVPIDLSEWPEARGFSRIYVHNPHFQARFIMALFGYRQVLVEGAHDEDAASAVDTVIRTFRLHFPEFMEDGYVPSNDTGTDTYYIDDRLRAYISRLDYLPPEPDTEY